jgi:hypothetical protein
MDHEEYLQSPAKRAQTDRIDRTVDHLLKWAESTQWSLRNAYRMLWALIISQVGVLIVLAVEVF